MDNSGVRGSGGGGVAGPSGLGRAVVLESAALQGIRREASVGPGHIQRRLRLLLQPISARSLRDHSYSVQTGKMVELEGGFVLPDIVARLHVAVLPLLYNAL